MQSLYPLPNPEMHIDYAHAQAAFEYDQAYIILDFFAVWVFVLDAVGWLGGGY